MSRSSTLALTFVMVALGFAATAEAEWPYNPYYNPPVFNSAPAVTGFTPWGVNTQNRTVNASAFDPYRSAAYNNGTRRAVNRPLVGANGQVIGHQTGEEWYNPVTGRMNGNVSNVTGNGMGGVNENRQTYSLKTSVRPR